MEGTSSSVPAPAEFRTVLSVVQEIASNDALSDRMYPLHPYSSNPETVISVLRNIIDATNDISASLNAQVTLPLSNPKTLSLLRQQTQISRTVHNADQMIRRTVETLRKRVGILYGENIPLERVVLVDWFMSKLETWGTSAGMEVFKEDEADGKITVMLGGKVMVVDINIAVDRTAPGRPVMKLSSVKTSYAIPNQSQGSTTNGSISLDGFLADSLRSFLDQIQKDEELQDPEEAARVSSRLSEDLRYLMSLDQLALREGDQGLRWFTHLDELSVHAEEVASKEAESVAKSISAENAPLDIFLMRAHALPLPYAAIPSISFLVYLSPLAYLSLLRTRPAEPSPLSNPFLPVLDIPFQHLRAYIAAHPRPPGATIATLVLTSEGPVLPLSSTMSIEVLATRPTFILHEAGVRTDTIFPLPLDTQVPTGKPHRWFLDFTDSGKDPGIVMSQARMREIETIVNPLGAGLTQDDGNVPIGFGSASWVDLLLTPDAQISPERYTSLYESPSSAHPPLQLRLAAPEEPGFFLERIPVRNLKEVWGVLEVVREQCWLNEIICSTEWLPDGLLDEGRKDSVNDQVATEDELQAVLEGTNSPAKIPVNIYIPTHIPPTSADEDPLFGSADMDIGIGLAQHTDHRATKIVLRAPEPPPGFGMFEIAVEYNCVRPRGVALKVEGALGADLDIDPAEEVCRRGGLLGLPGRVWAKLHERA